jgi:hypothetical protein
VVGVSEERYVLEGSPAALESLRRELVDAVGDSVRIELESRTTPGVLREPVLIALVLSFASTTGVAIRTVGKVIERRLAHVERMEELRLVRESDERQIDVAEMVEELGR